MSLDICILQNDGCPIQTFSLSVNQHWELLNEFKNHAEYLMRMGDYYSDVDYTYEEVKILFDELSSFVCIADSPLFQIVNEFKKICNDAITAKKGLSIISD